MLKVKQNKYGFFNATDEFICLRWHIIGVLAKSFSNERRTFYWRDGLKIWFIVLAALKKEEYILRKSGVVNDSSPRIDLEKAFDVNIHGFATVHKIIVLLPEVPWSKILLGLSYYSESLIKLFCLSVKVTFHKWLSKRIRFIC